MLRRKRKSSSNLFISMTAQLGALIFAFYVPNFSNIPCPTFFSDSKFKFQITRLGALISLDSVDHLPQLADSAQLQLDIPQRRFPASRRLSA